MKEFKPTWLYIKQHANTGRIFTNEHKKNMSTAAKLRHARKGEAQ